MKLEYDRAHDVAYLALAPSARGVAARTTRPCITLPSPWDESTGLMLLLDWDVDGRIVGMEVSPASLLLQAALLATAEEVS